MLSMICLHGGLVSEWVAKFDVADADVFVNGFNGFHARGQCVAESS